MRHTAERADERSFSKTSKIFGRIGIAPDWKPTTSL
jgi:hypothetical protein